MPRAGDQLTATLNRGIPADEMTAVPNGGTTVGRMAVLPIDETESLVKSADRVRDLGEVYTPASTVRAMLDLLPDDVWQPHPSPTFLEPACGNGNFLVAVFERKAEAVIDAWANGRLPAGDDTKALLYHLLEALASIYGVDISDENILGSEAHPAGARPRMLSHFHRRVKRATGQTLARTTYAARSAAWIVEHNLVVGDMLGPDGTGRYPEVPIYEYRWDPIDARVEVAATSMADAISETRAETYGNQGSFFDGGTPVAVWDGPGLQIHRVRAEEDTS